MTPKQIAALMAHPAVIDVEDGGMDEGRFFVHLKPEWDWNIAHDEVRRVLSFGSAREARAALRKAIRIEGEPIFDAAQNGWITPGGKAVWHDAKAESR